MRNKFTRVFKLSTFILSMILLLGILIPDKFDYYTSSIKKIITTDFGWMYLLLVMFILFVCIFFIISPIGQIKLGDPHSEPEYTTSSWLAMLFSAGMGIGLVFYGAAEPLSHFAISTPNARPMSAQALADSFRFTFFHWGIHAWSIYAIVALSLAYFGFRKKEKYLLSVGLKPILGDKTEGIIGNVVDSITIIATVIGVSTTLGFGSVQINGGLNYLFGIPNNVMIQICIIIITTILFLISAMSGLGKGVKILSNINLILAIGILSLVIIVGPTVRIFDTFTNTIGLYLQNFFIMSFRSAAFFNERRSWINSWTIFYWAWWISWSPFVGVFIARISKGRTIREFITFVLLVPTILSFLWFSSFGVLSINVQESGIDLTSFKVEEILFATYNNYSIGIILSIITVILICTFFITSADSATFVLGMLSENGNLNPKNNIKIIWGIILSVIRIVLLLSGGLSALQNILIIVAFPFSLIMVFIVISLIKELLHEQKEMGLKIKPERYPDKSYPFKSYDEK